MKTIKHPVGIMLTVLSVMISTATFACPTLPVSHAATTPQISTFQSGFQWHDGGNPTGNGPNGN